jgi:hypothetical protein
VKLARTLLAVIALAAAAAVAALAASPNRQARPANHVQSFFNLFTDEPLVGGQVPPREYKWVNENVSAFVQFDRTRQAEARALRYIGISVKGTFCAESQPDRAFTHYHRVTSPTYGSGHGGRPGENRGYWLLWVAVDEFDSGGAHILPGVDYAFSPTPAPACGGNAPPPDFQGPGAHRLTRREIGQLARFFTDNPFRGRQKAPRLYRWVSGDVLVWLQFDKATPSRARSLRYIGIAKRGAFCSEDRPHADFTSFQQLSAPTWAKGRGGRKGRAGFWHLALAVDKFRMPWGNVTPGVDRRFARTPVPNCSKA